MEPRTTVTRGSERLSTQARAWVCRATRASSPNTTSMTGGYEAELEPLCRENRLGVICYYALASGFLTGKYRSEADFGKSARGQRMSKYLNERGRRILAALDEVAAQHRATPAQVALAWLIARPGLTAPIASATSLYQ